MLHKEIPFLRIGLPLCSGIISGLYFTPENNFSGVVTAIIVSGFIISLLYNKYQTNLIFGFTLTISLFFCGLVLYTIEKSSITVLKPEQGLFACTLSDYPEEKDNSYRLKVKIDHKITRGGSEPIEGSMIIYNKKDANLASFLPGDLLIIRCTPVEITNRGNPYEFDYRFFMENQGIKYYSFTSSTDLIRHIVPKHRNLTHRALIIRERIIEMYRERGITGDNLALVAAITLGQKNMLDPEQKQNFIKAGVMHIMAVSGLHSVILSLFVFSLLFFLKGRLNILRILITLLILWSFAFVTGLTPSVLRATMMFSFLQAGNLMNRKVNGINSVLASAFVLILIKPSVIFDSGFLLSYSAVIYIISFYQDFYLKVQFNNWLADKIWQSAVVTIVAQAGTLPLTIMLFNRFPTYFILTNIIIVPLSSLLIITGCLVPMLFPVKFLSQFLATILDYLTGFTESLTERASSLPYSSIENIGMTTIECILLSLAIYVFSHFLLKKKRFSILFPIALFILFLTSGTVKEITARTTNELIVYNTPGTSVIGIRTGKILNLYSDTSGADRPEVRKHCSTLGLRIKAYTPENSLYCIRTGKINILICNKINKSILQKFNPEIVILTDKNPEVERNNSLNQSVKTLIITSEAVSGFRIPKQVHFAGIDSVHYTKKYGAYIKRI